MGQPFDATILNRLARDKLIHLLETRQKDKALVIQSALMKPLDRLLGAKLLRQHGVARMYRFEDFVSSAVDDALHHVFLVKPSLTVTGRIVKLFASRLDAAPTAAATCQIIYVPKKLAICDAILERHGALGVVEVTELDWSLLSIDEGILSFELDDYFPTTFIDHTTVWCQTVARALWHFQSLFGPFPDQAFCFGKSADVVANLTEDALDQLGRSRQRQPCCTHLILIDRIVDPVAVLLSGLTYETLLDDHFGIESGFLDLPKSLRGQGSPPANRLQLNTVDSVYSDIRDQHFTAVFAALKERTEVLQAEFDQRQRLDVDQMKAFVKHTLRRLKQQRQSLALHIGLSELIVAEKNLQHFDQFLEAEHAVLCKLDYSRTVQYIEHFMARRFPAEMTFCFLCLLSVVNQGLAHKDFATLRRRFLQAYGYDYLLAFGAMDKCNFFSDRQASGSSPTKCNTSQMIRERFRLVSMANVDLKQPKCPSYVFNGAYIPLACQLIMQIVANLFPSDQSAAVFRLKEFSWSQKLESNLAPAQTVFAVVFLGGVTRAEVAALRLVERLYDCQIRILTTGLLSKRSLLKMCVSSAVGQ